MTTLWTIVGVWAAIALAAAFWVGAAMRHADHGERRRLQREQEQSPRSTATGSTTTGSTATGTDDVRTA